jgi:TRAP-type C4-dicarboxylate transport system permease small subunit
MMKKTRQFEDLFIWRALVWLIKALLIISSAASVLTIVLSVLMRYVFKSNLFGVEELITLFAMWLYFIGGVHGSYQDTHINADVLTSFIRSAKLKAVLRIVVTGICLACSLVFAVWGIQYFLWSVKLGGYSVSLHIPMILSKIPMSICFLLMVVYNIYHFVNAILGRDPKKPEKQTSAEREVCVP